MDEEEKVKIFNKGLREGINHKRPSRSTQRFMEYIKDKLSAQCEDINRLKDGYADLHTEYEVMCKDIQFIKQDIKELKDTLNDFVLSADNRYASKTVEKILWAAGGVVGTALVVTVLKVVLKLPI